ncbi:hypothetical protein [Staphylococcus pseudintermedius]|uniref:hypothetical protein n=1 Tax=Staphylococcus pseudintermedius TaxID=283734 RepID=UPI0028BE3793|nr:hypothetical protein [Staphylococcus pseudintermedius]
MWNNVHSIMQWIFKKSEHRADEFTSSSNASAVIPEQTLNEVIRRARTQVAY